VEAPANLLGSSSRKDQRIVDMLVGESLSLVKVVRTIEMEQCAEVAMVLHNEFEGD
jgi:hypothetical protein